MREIINKLHTQVEVLTEDEAVHKGKDALKEVQDLAAAKLQGIRNLLRALKAGMEHTDLQRNADLTQQLGEELHSFGLDLASAATVITQTVWPEK